MSLDSINAALDQARETAKNVAPPTSTALAPASAGGAVSTVVSPGRPVSMREMLAQSTSMSCKAFLKVDRLAFLVGKDDKLFKEFEVEFRLSEAQPFFGLRYGSSPARYERSLDRQVNAKSGKAWVDCIQEAQRLDPKCRGDYPSVDLPFTVTEDITGEAGAVIVSKGEKIGWTSSITNFKDFKEFISPYYALMDAGKIGEDALVRGKIKHVKRSGNEDYGALTFVDFQVVDAGTLKAA